MKRRRLRFIQITAIPIAMLFMALIMTTFYLTGVQSAGGILVSTQTAESTEVVMDENATWGEVVHAIDRLPANARISIGGPIHATKK